MSAWGKGGSSLAAAVKEPPKPSSSLAAAAAAAVNKPRATATAAATKTASAGGRTSGSHAGGSSGRGHVSRDGRQGGGGRGGGPHSSKVQFKGEEKASRTHGGPAAPSSSSKKRPPQAKSDKPASSSNSKKVSTKTLDEIHLLTESSDTITRLSHAQFLACRMDYLEAPLDWTPHNLGHWTNKERLAKIQEEMDRIWLVQPLQVNDETRWKPKHVKANSSSGSEDPNGDNHNLTEVQQEQLGQAFAILNKLSWTTLDKLTVSFLQALGVPATTSKDKPPVATSPNAAAAVLSMDVVQKVMQLLVTKAMLEPHFAELYARFADKLVKVSKAFKKTLLALCQQLFEEQDAAVVADVASDETTSEPLSPEAARDKLLEEGLARKRSIGLMHFIGELYHVGLIKGHIMIACLQRLLQPDDEERLDCFCKLMTTIGSRLHDDNTEQDKEMQAVWTKVYYMAGKEPPAELLQNVDMDQQALVSLKAPSVRVKFLLQDLTELKNNNWVHRRKQEKAKSLKEIHKEVAQEEAAQRRQSQQSSVSTGGMLRKSSSSTSMVRSQSTSSAVTLDDDGFVSVAKPKRAPFRRAASEGVTKQQAANGTKSSLQAAIEGKGKSSKPPPRVTQPADDKILRAVSPSSPTTESPAAKSQEHFDSTECAKRGKSLFKEYFVGGDIEDAVLTMDEIVDLGSEGHVDRGAAMIEASILMVLEMKQDDVDKMICVLERCIGEKKISSESLVAGVQTPMEVLRDVEIDAPLAAKLMACILASWLRLGVISLDMLQSCPEYFLTDGRPAEFACRVLIERGGSASDDESSVVQALMNSQEKESHPSLQDWMASLKA